MAVAGEATGNSLLYWFVNRALVRTGRMPPRIEKLMARWMKFLIIHDERIILLNRVFPVVPFVGAFMAALKWNYPRSLAVIIIGGGAQHPPPPARRPKRPPPATRRSRPPSCRPPGGPPGG